MHRSAPLFALALALALLPAPPADAKPPKEKGAKSAPPGQARKEGTSPGLAKKGGLPPGLAKKMGAPAPTRVWVAFDRRRDDRAWFLIDGAWVLRSGFEAAVRAEVKAAFALPPLPAPPPVPLPKVGVDLHVVLFE